MKRIRFPLLSALATLALALHSDGALAAELKVLSSLAFTDAWRQLKPQFEARGHQLNLVLEPSGRIAKRVSDGEAGDAVLNTTSSIDGLSKDGKVVAGTSKYVASSAVGISVRKGTPKPDISTPEALKQVLLSARAVAYSDPAGGGASGIHFAKVLQQPESPTRSMPKLSWAAACPMAKLSLRERPTSPSNRSLSSCPSRVPSSSAHCRARFRTSRRSRRQSWGQAKAKRPFVL